MHQAIAFAPAVQKLIVLVGFLCWSGVYWQMWRRGVRDRSFGMPLVALCVNVVWEIVFTFFADGPMPVKVVNGLWLGLDLAVLSTLLRFGRDDYASAWVRDSFYMLVALVFAMAALVVPAFKSAFADTTGGISATFTTMLLSAQLVAMLVRRDNVRGQSIYIGLLVLLGDVAGWAMNHIAHAEVQPNIPILWVNAANVCIVACNVVYLVLYWRISRRDGVDPWSRFVAW